MGIRTPMARTAAGWSSALPFPWVTAGTRAQRAPAMDRGGCLQLGQRRQVDDEPIAHVALHHPVVRLVDPLDRDQLDVRHDSLLRAEVQHLLGLLDTADGRA